MTFSRVKINFAIENQTFSCASHTNKRFTNVQMSVLDTVAYIG